MFLSASVGIEASILGALNYNGASFIISLPDQKLVLCGSCLHSESLGIFSPVNT
jgi:hypothetical protein